MILITLTTLTLAISCLGFKQEANFLNYENKTIVNLFLRTMILSVPSVDRSGLFRHKINRVMWVRKSNDLERNSKEYGSFHAVMIFFGSEKLFYFLSNFELNWGVFTFQDLASSLTPTQLMMYTSTYPNLSNALWQNSGNAFFFLS
jgi:hypothetical protein